MLHREKIMLHIFLLLMLCVDWL